MVSEQVAALRGALAKMGAEHRAIGDGVTQVTHGGMTWFVRHGAQGFHAECISPMTMGQAVRVVLGAPDDRVTAVCGGDE